MPVSFKKIGIFFKGLWCKAFGKRNTEWLVDTLNDVTIFDIFVILMFFNWLHLIYITGVYKFLVGCFELFFIFTFLILTTSSRLLSWIISHWEAIQAWVFNSPTVDSVLPQAVSPQQEVVPFEEVPEEKSWVVKNKYILCFGAIAFWSLSVGIVMYLE